MRPLPKLLSKTKLMRGYRCLKSIHLTVHHPELEAPVTPDQQAVFDQGHEVGEEARRRFPGGVLVDNKPWDFGGSLKRTRELLAHETEIIYEAAFEHQGCYARADIIQYVKETQRWKIFEVKSSTRVKPEHLEDVGLQAWIMAKSGLPIEQINIMHLNSECRHPELDKLFVCEDVTPQLRALYPGTLGKVREIFTVLKSDRIPAVDIGPHCESPNGCSFFDSCWKEKAIPEPSVFDLPQIRERKWELYGRGILRLDDARLTELTPLQSRAVEVFSSGRRYVDHEGLSREISKWAFPLIFLDFETVNPAIPRYPGTRPYQQVPFQFSAHSVASPGAAPVHKEYLHTDATDPRPALVEKLLEACGTSGNIVAYYGKFESARIAELADHFPQLRARLEALIERIVDPLPLLREHVYDSAFRGSFSLKSVAPALLGKDRSYDGMLVSDGSAAQRAFAEIITTKTSDRRREELIRASLEYCRKDTLMMLELVKWMMNPAS